MKKFLIAAAASLLIFGSQADVEASTADNSDLQGVQTQETGHWANFRDEVILGRESDRERRKRKEWERRHRYQPPPPRPLPPPPNYGGGRPLPPPPNYGRPVPPPAPPGRMPPPPPPLR